MSNTQDAELADLKEQLEVKDQLIRELEAANVRKDAVIAEKDTIIAQKDREIDAYKDDETAAFRPIVYRHALEWGDEDCGVCCKRAVLWDEGKTR